MHAFKACAILTTIFVVKIHCEHNNEPAIIRLKNGQVRGKVLTSYKGREFLAFRGIRYGKPPVNDLRFKPPQPAESWKGIYDATTDGPECPQMAFPSTKIFHGDEDCLVLNVYTPQESHGKKMPVLVYIHGGGFYFGTGMSEVYGPQKFMDLDVVLVTMNYRLGALGFLSTGDENAPGNYGMLDQVQALHWVQDNIKEFSGDPERVLLFGLSAGGASVSYLMLSPLAKGLFHAAIAHSGTTQCHWAFQKTPCIWTKQIAAKLKCPTDNSFEIVKCLQTISAEDLVKASNSLQLAEFYPMYLSPVVDFPHGAGFLPEEPLKLLKDGRISNVPFITGVTQDEGIMFYRSMLSAGIFENIKEFFTEDFPHKHLPLLADIPSNKLSETAKMIQTEYFGNDDTVDMPSFEEKFSEFLGDLMFNVGADMTLKYISRAGIPTYAYKYTYQSTEGMVANGMFGKADDKYVAHGDELSMQFQFTPLPGKNYTKYILDNRRMFKLLNTVWKNFAEIRKPSFSGTYLETDQVEWTAFNPDNPNFLEFNLTPTMKIGTFSKRTQFWDEINSESHTKHEEL